MPEETARPIETANARGSRCRQRGAYDFLISNYCVMTPHSDPRHRRADLMSR